MVSRRGETKIGYISGPVDARVVHDSWRTGTPLGYFGTSYLLQFYEIAAELGVELIVTTSAAQPRYDDVRPGVHIMNRPRRAAAGLRYHLHEIAWLWGRVRETAASGARIIVLTDAMFHWWALLPWRWRGVRFVNALHCAILRPAAREPLIRRVIARLLAWCHYRFADPTLAASPLIVAQVKALSGGRIDATLFLPTYAPAQFAAIAPPAAMPQGDFHVVFAGRVEHNKGVFDMLEACRRLHAEGGRRIVFHICGEGTASPALQDAVRAADMEELFLLHGFCDRAALTQRLSESDAVVVPTRSDFEEGFAMIVAEGVIARRPVVTSRVCPALELVHDAAVEVAPDDVAGYAAALRALASDATLYARKVAATAGLRAAFFDETNGYGAKLRVVLRRLIG
ncbi:glycosyltransferase family 4 protein [Sphingomonas sp. 8AM]|uniref:glycosyltransferase family 4 protein n=1 Tax=Sphingomonas sp. 8AM TaxID=2653170 RepID=UPI0012F33BEF|nr:glycosyltransferase family 4 protein [Sphingomonas sp. 8AM]VXC69749.1 putative Glycosyltransferase [Sphingomonas sp. 8AM]